MTFYYKYSIKAIIIILYEVNLNHVDSIPVYSGLIKQYVLPNYCWEWHYIPNTLIQTKSVTIGRDRMLVEFTTTCAISAYHH